MADGTGGTAREGRLEAIWIKRARRGPMDPAEEGVLDPEGGLEGNANYGHRRQITIIEREVFDRLRDELDPEVDPAMRRANLMVSGVALRGSRGRVLRVGEGRIRIDGETRPCHRMDEACDGLREALEPEWRGGAWGVVEKGGTIRPGDPVVLEDAAPGD